MRSMKYTYLAEEDYSHTATFALGDLCAEFSKQGFDVTPLEVGAGRVNEQEVERALMLPLHERGWYQKSVLGATTGTD
jgi:hypothetical protein